MDLQQQQTGSATQSPRFLRLFRIIFFLSTFSWSFNKFEEYASGGTPVEKLFGRILPLFITIIYIFFTPQFRTRLRNVFKPVFWPVLFYILLGVLCGVSGVQPLLSIWKGFELFVALSWVATVCEDESCLKRELHEFVFYIEILMYVTVVLALVNPSRGFLHSSTVLPWIQGYFPMLNPNTIGFLDILVINRLLLTDVKYKPVRLAATVVILLCAQSRTQYIVFAAILIIYMIDALRHRKLFSVLLASFAAMCFAFVAFGTMDILISIFRRGQSNASMESLSGRTKFWQIALDNAGLFGGGFATGSRSLVYLAEDVFTKGAVNLHNTYLEAILGAGFVGAAAFLGQLAINTLRQLFRFLVSNWPDNGLFAGFAIILFARSIMSIGPALFTIDFCTLLLFWLYVSMTSKISVAPFVPPQPRIRTNAEIAAQDLPSPALPE